MQFKLHAVDRSGARRGEFTTAHGTVQTPTFMPVGTAGFIRSTTPRDIAETGAQVILANTYHMSLGDRLQTVTRAGGLHNFMGWQQTILTDSGGFQVFSLPDTKITSEGVEFSYDEGGERVQLTPEKSMLIQRELGSDIVMAFDECVGYPAEETEVRHSVKRTTEWGQRCREVELDEHQFLFGIVQGGTYPGLRRQSAQEISRIDFDGFAIGGVSVGEGHQLLREITGLTAPLLPPTKPRYLMGVGLPEDVITAVHRGVDMMDCVIPTRYARQGTLFSRTGKLRIMDKTFRKDKYPVDTKCGCYTCQTYSRMVLRYLFFTKDPLAETLATIHNVTFYQDLMRDIRQAIENNDFENFQSRWLNTYLKKGRK
ncbi:MAG: tRNA guanosine(34) transglycosylase Tgt [Lentisphaeria bacterium]|nr:tRNA guanosine(34) transglycosylase Tgt [Candidatus Neomarinimicrobiota bacterium]MCF7843042.1 tRNA guanosine(34) transglycosylase Tgt [Lentisphaeria bacterium]